MKVSLEISDLTIKFEIGQDLIKGKEVSTRGFNGVQIKEANKALPDHSLALY